VVVDTGSADDTPRLAAGAGARVSSYPWADDFSAARNHALDQVRAQWVLYVDADERVSVPSPAALRAALAGATGTVAFRVPFRATVGSTPYLEMRLWRHRPDIRFAGRMHESVVEAIVAAAQRDGLDVGVAPLEIQHLGYEGDLVHKHVRNLPLLEAQLAVVPRRVYLWEELGLAHRGLGHHDEAVAAWWEGVRLIRADGLGAVGDASVYAHLVGALRARGEAVGPLVAELSSVAPTYRFGWWLVAQSASDEGRWADAVGPLRQLLAQDPDRPGPDGAGEDRRLFGEWAWHQLGTCLFQLGRDAEAADAFERALAAAPGSLEYRAKAAAARHRAERSAVAATPEPQGG
jgi:tetratricopeptide (TPR) repeat protein